MSEWRPAWVIEQEKLPLEERSDDYIVSCYFNPSTPEEHDLALKTARRLLLLDDRRYDYDARRFLRNHRSEFKRTRTLVICETCKGEGYVVDRSLGDYHRGSYYHDNYLVCDECDWSGLVEVTTETFITQKPRKIDPMVRQAIFDKIKADSDREAKKAAQLVDNLHNQTTNSDILNVLKNREKK